MKITAFKGKVLVTELEGGSRIINGIIIPDDNGKSEGIRPRWGKVYAVGEDITEITPGQWVLVENGRWTRMVEVKEDDGTRIKLWGVEYPASVHLVSDDFPEDAAIFSEFSQKNEHAPSF
jgi:co-chaperonin GroES (HSP10)